MSSARRERAPGTAAAALGVPALICLAYAGALVAGERFYFRDLSQNHGPVFEGARRLLHSGWSLWWNPWRGGGEPLAANPNSLLLHPLGLIALLMPHGTGMTGFILVGSVLGPVFMVLLLRDAGRSVWGAATGALVFGLSGYAISLGTLPNLLASICFIPMALYFIRRARWSPWWIPAAVLATACVLVPCEPVSACVLAVFALLPFGEARTRPPAGKGHWAREAGRVSVLLAGGLLTGAYQLLPAASWIRESARGAGLTRPDMLKWSLGAARVPEMVVPGFLGDPALVANWWSGNLFETGFPLFLSLYVGATALILAAAGLWSTLRIALARRSGSGVLAAFAVPLAGAFFVILATGTGVPALASVLPSGGFFRYPEKFVLGFVLAIAFEAALGVDGLISLWREEPGSAPSRRGFRALLAPRRDWPVFALAATASVGLEAIHLAAPAGWAARWFSLETLPRAIHTEALKGVADSLGYGAAATCVLVLSVMFLPLLPASARGLALTGSLLLSLLAGTLVLGPGPLPWRLRASPSGTGELFDREPFFAERLARLREEGGRFFRFDRPLGFAVKNRTGTMADGFSWDRRSLSRSSSSEFGIELAFDRSTDLLNPSGSAGARVFFMPRPLHDQARFWDLADVRLVLSFEPLVLDGLVASGKNTTESTPGMLLYENTRALPRVRLVGRAKRVGSDQEAFESIIAEGDAGRNSVRLVVPATLGSGPLPGDAEGAAQAPPETHGDGPLPGEGEVPIQDSPAPPVGARTPGRELTTGAPEPGRVRVRIGPAGGGARPAEAASSQGAWLIVSENHVTGWRATLDGAPCRIYRADGMNMAVRIPDGRAHEVELRYFPPGLAMGSSLSILVLALATIAGALGLRRRRTSLVA